MACVFVGAPYLARARRPRSRRPLLERFGIEGRLAVDNSVRNPKRTATTANALLIGVFLVTLVAVAGASVRDFAVGEINDLQSADYVVVSKGGTIDEDFVAKLARRRRTSTRWSPSAASRSRSTAGASSSPRATSPR